MISARETHPQNFVHRLLPLRKKAVRSPRRRCSKSPRRRTGSRAPPARWPRSLVPLMPVLARHRCSRRSTARVPSRRWHVDRGERWIQSARSADRRSRRTSTSAGHLHARSRGDRELIAIDHCGEDRRRPRLRGPAAAAPPTARLLAEIAAELECVQPGHPSSSRRRGSRSRRSRASVVPLRPRTSGDARWPSAARRRSMSEGTAVVVEVDGIEGGALEPPLHRGVEQHDGERLRQVAAQAAVDVGVGLAADPGHTMLRAAWQVMPCQADIGAGESSEARTAARRCAVRAAYTMVSSDHASDLRKCPAAHAPAQGPPPLTPSRDHPPWSARRARSCVYAGQEGAKIGIRYDHPGGRIWPDARRSVTPRR